MAKPFRISPAKFKHAPGIRRSMKAAESLAARLRDLPASAPAEPEEDEIKGWPEIIADLERSGPVQLPTGLKVRYAVLPARALVDPKLRHSPALTVLAALGLFWNRRGIAYPGLRTLGAIIGRGPDTVCRWIAYLVAQGYLRRLVPKGRPMYGKPRTSRYQLLVEANAPVPEYEIPFTGRMARGWQPNARTLRQRRSSPGRAAA